MRMLQFVQHRGGGAQSEEPTQGAAALGDHRPIRPSGSPSTLAPPCWPCMAVRPYCRRPGKVQEMVAHHVMRVASHGLALSRSPWIGSAINPSQEHLTSGPTALLNELVVRLSPKQDMHQHRVLWHSTGKVHACASGAAYGAARQQSLYASCLQPMTEAGGRLCALCSS